MSKLQYKPLIVFNEGADTGVDEIPVNSYVQIHTDGADSRLILVTSTSGFDDLTTVTTLLGTPANYSSVLTDSDPSGVGITVQGYDVDTVKSDIATTFTAPQRTTAIAEDNVIDFTQGNDFILTATAADIGTPTVTGCTGQSGVITIHSASNVTGWDALYKFRAVPTGLGGGLQTTDRFSYYIESETSIVIGLVQ